VAYDEGLAHRVRELLGEDEELRERKMFGGLAFMYRGNMACGVIGEDLMVRVGPEAWEEALEHPHARQMDFTGKSMKGMVYVDTSGTAEDDDLREWVTRGILFARSLPAK
jgi:TfoX/Sxy family transcriptional regulator of competence genes